jgi:hypothetical protein
VLEGARFRRASDKSTFGEADNFAAGDDQVIEDPNVHQAERFALWAAGRNAKQTPG